MSDLPAGARPPTVLYVDVVPFSVSEGELRFLLLKRSPAVALPSTWQPVSGKLLAEEPISAGFFRQILDKTGLRPTGMYRVPTVNLFYDPSYDCVLCVPVAAAEVGRTAAVKLQEDLHVDHEWLPAAAAMERVSFPAQAEYVRLVCEGLRTGTLTPVPPP